MRGLNQLSDQQLMAAVYAIKHADCDQRGPFQRDRVQIVDVFMGHDHVEYNQSAQTSQIPGSAHPIPRRLVGTSRDNRYAFLIVCCTQLAVAPPRNRNRLLRVTAQATAWLSCYN